MAATMRRDRRILGSYLRKPNNIFGSTRSSGVGVGMFPALQDGGVVRKDVDPAVTAHIVDMLSYRLVTIQDFRSPDEVPDFDTVMEAIADMMDRLLTPDSGGGSEAGKAIIRRLATTAIAQFEAMSKHV
jgi:hypothetical protein